MQGLNGARTSCGVAAPRNALRTRSLLLRAASHPCPLYRRRMLPEVLHKPDNARGEAAALLGVQAVRLWGASLAGNLRV